MFWNYLAVMAGGAAGVGGRMFLANYVTQRATGNFPIEILLVNVLGCLVIGVFTGLTGPGGVWVISPLLRQVVTVGVLGGFTTFSSFSLQTITLLTTGQFTVATANIVLSVTLCLLGTWLGLWATGVWAK